MGIATCRCRRRERAADELKRAMTKLGLRGAMFGSNVMGKNLDDPSFEPLWATAEELGAFMFIHPNNVAGADRLKSYYLANLIGNPLDTTIAAACLVFGGVHRPLSENEDHAGAWRRLHALSGGALGARLAGAARAEEEHAGAAEEHRRALLSTTPSCIPTPALEFLIELVGATTCCSAATIPTTWACSIACATCGR